MTPVRKIRILVVDDSAIVRKILTDSLDAETDLEVVGSAPDPYVARDKILQLKPDVVTLDIEMPRMDGLTFLQKLMHYHPLPVIVISSIGEASCYTALEALRLGAVEVLAKPAGPYSVGELRMTLANKIRAAAAARLRREAAKTSAVASNVQSTLPSDSLDPAAVIAMGASTGGTEAIQAVLAELPKNCPGIVIAQHIPSGFSRAFAERLNQICRMEVREAIDGDRLFPGLALIAPGDFHMLLRGGGGAYRVVVKCGPRVCYQRPSVDVLFGSVADAAGAGAIGILLTGMGADGAQGLLKMKQAGARTIVQDEATCVVFGMPREAIGMGAADQVLPLHRIAPAILAGLQLGRASANSKLLSQEIK
jgi:two-component system chemotaxis response regulator CheB